MNEFKASNGLHVTPTEDGRLIIASVEGTYPYTIADGEEVEALSEFFRADNDIRHGRWRWPENPDYVVYPRHREGGGRPDSFRVFQESTGNTWSYDLKNLGNTRGEPWDAARAYFDAHPEPKPWHDPKPGEVWLLTIDGESIPALVLADRAGTFGGNAKFETAHRGAFGPAASAISDGRRIEIGAAT
ncbi:hypothetical protein [Microbacterium sp.]|uniref:hypothetical protein n=1 Tax=Microbacterium sp. TaxID=51671 RepID=UPI0039E5A277